MKERFINFKKEDFFKNVNLHIHSKYSDGKTEFSELINQAKKLDLKCFSITDHNTVEGYKKFGSIPKEMVTGIEFDCYFDLNLPHILGYGIDVYDEELNKLTSKFQEGLFEIPKRILKSRNPKTVIDAIHKAGGIAILAHPCCYWCFNLDKFIKKLVDMGLDGIEVYYPYNRLTRIAKFHSRKTVKKLAEKYNLIITGGQDQHKNLTGEIINGDLF